MILVTGGTGALGRELVPQLVAAGERVRVLTRVARDAAPGVEYVAGDLQTGEGVDAAVVGAETVIHAAGSAKGDGAKAANLISALQRAGVAKHLLYVSVVGADTTPMLGRIDRSTLGYFDEKRKAEVVVEGSGISWTILRATQFHTFLSSYADLALKLPFIPSFAGFRYQPIDPRDVAERMVQLAAGAPAGYATDIGGPEIYPMEDLLRSYLRAKGKRRPVIPMQVPGAAARAQRAGANLSPGHATGTVTWEDFLARVERG